MRTRSALLATATAVAAFGAWVPAAVAVTDVAPANLPDGRVLEQVSPVDKDGALFASSTTDPVAVSADGDSLLWDTVASALPPSTTATAPNLVQPYVFTRGASGGWTYQEALPPDDLVLYRAVVPDQLFGVSADLGTTIATTFFGLTDGHDGITGTPVQTTGNVNNPHAIQNLAANVLGGAATVLTPPLPGSQVGPAAPQYTPGYVGNSATADHIVYAAKASFPVANGTVPGSVGSNPFVYDYTGGQLLQVGLETDNATPFPQGVVAPQIPGVVSSDGSKVFFEADAAGNNAHNQLFARENDSGASPETVPVSISDRTVADANCTRYANGGAATAAPATFQGATPAGSLAFFLSSCELTNASNTGTSDTNPDLYEYNTSTNTVTDLAVDSTDTTTGAHVLGVVGYSTDGSYVYFVADGLIDGSGAPNTPSAPKLYVSHGGTVAYLATLNSADSADWTPGATLTPNGSEYAAAQVSPNGQYALITSVNDLTAYHAAGTAELFEFSVAGGSPICVSCVPSGASPTGAPSIAPNSLSNSGQVFFQSPDGLVSADQNGAPDVYEWQGGPLPANVDTASDSYGGGTISLLSSGASAISTASGAPSSLGSTLLAASPSGDDVFFVTRDQLTPQDQDDLNDIYDARVGGVTTTTTTTSAAAPSPGAAPTFQAPNTDSTGTNVTTTTTRTATVTPPPKVITVSVVALTARQRSADAKSGTVKLTLKVSGATTASAVVKAKIAGKTVVVARASRKLTAAGSATLSLSLSKAARRVLAGRRALRLTITVTETHGTAHTTTITLKR